MNLIRISNLFNLLVQESEFFRAYHFGYQVGLAANVQNNFNVHGNTGIDFPLVLWAAPVEGELMLRDRWDTLDIELFFYHLQGYGNDGEPTGLERTYLVQWDELKKRAVEFIHAIHSRREYKVKEGRVRYFTDQGQGIQSLICVGMTFSLFDPYACEDYESQSPPLGASIGQQINSTDDLEVPDA